MKPTQDQIQMADDIARHNAEFNRMVERVAERVFAMAIAAAFAWALVSFITPCAEGMLC